MKKRLIAIATLLWTAPSFALMPAWCGRYLNTQMVSAHNELVQELTALPDAVRVRSYAQGTSQNRNLIDDRRGIFSYPIEIATLDFVVAATEEKVEEASLRRLVESLFTIQDPTSLPGSPMNLTLAQIPGTAAAMLCDGRCAQETRLALRQKAKEEVELLSHDGVKRKSLEAVLEDLQTSIEGLNSIVESHDEHLRYLNYRRYYLTLLERPEGSLLLTNRIQQITGPALEPEEIENGHAHHSTKISLFDLRAAVQENYSRLKAAWSARREWIEERANEETKANVPFPHEKLVRLKKLALFLTSAPFAVAEVFKEHPELTSDLCWILRDVDNLSFSEEWQKTVSHLGLYIAPLEVAVIAGIFLAGGGLGMIPLYIALITLKGITGYQIYGLLTHAEHLQKDYVFHKTNAVSGYSSLKGLNELEHLREAIGEHRSEAALVAALEVGSLGAGHLIALRAEKLFAAASDAEKLAWLSRLFSSKRGLWKLHELKIWTKKDLKGWFEKASHQEVEALLFTHKNFGFAKSLLLTEAGIDVFQETLKMSHEKVFDELNPFESLAAALRAN